MIIYQDNLEDITPAKLEGFFVGWGKRPSPETHLRLLASSAYIMLAVDTEQDKVVGFVSAISDQVLCAFIPNLEVLPEYQGQGIGTELMQRILKNMEHLYSIDLMCDLELQPFYQRLGMQTSVGMVIRNYHRQDGG